MKRPLPPPPARLLLLFPSAGRGRSTRHLAASLLASATVLLVSCQVHHQVPSNEVGAVPEGRITAVATVGGDTVRFDPPRYDRSRPGVALVAPPEIRADTLFATVDGEPYRLPIDQVRRYWVTSISKGKSIGLGAGVLAGVLVGIVVAIGLAFSSMTL